MPKFNTYFAISLLLCSSPLWAADKAAQELAASAFKNPPISFQSRLILTEWNGSDSHAEEVNLFYSPPGVYKIEFLDFDGTIKKVVVNDVTKNQMNMKSGNKNPSPLNYPPQFPHLLPTQEMEALLKKNYKFNIKGTEIFIGRAVWVLDITPEAKGKPQHQLKIDKETLVVLEHRRFLPNDKIGSLTRFSTFEPYKTFAADTFSLSATSSSSLSTDKKDFEMAKPSELRAPPAEMRNLPAGFSLSSYNVFQVEGTEANHFYYSDGALPLSIFETSLPVHFPDRANASEKMDFMVVPTYGISSVDQVAYGKRRGKYITVVGEASPVLLQSIAHRFQ